MNSEDDPWAPQLRQHTPARIAQGRSGSSLRTADWLRFAADHAQARDAVHLPLDVAALTAELSSGGWRPIISVQSQASTREVYLRRPDLGRRLSTPIDAATEPTDLAVVLADGLSAASLRHAPALLNALRLDLADTLSWAPLVIATQARVALGDEIGALMKARVALVLIGERPGLSSPDSLGAYLTFAPSVGRSDAQRNCVSNIRQGGLGLAPADAARRIAWLLRESLRRQLSGVALKDDSESVLMQG